MAHLACVGSHAINGVAELHSELLKHEVLRDFYDFYPEKFSNKTNGISPRRWLLVSNPKLAQLISENIGRSWPKDLGQLKKLEKLAANKDFCRKWARIKQENKQDLAEYISQKNGVHVDPDSLFDIQVKRIHEYKRQVLFALYMTTLYNRIKQNPHYEAVPRTCIVGGKAAPGYFMAKLVIKLINSIAEVVNNDPAANPWLKVIFLENFSVSLGERVYPAADLSEQISTAGKEASGTGNMKFTMNGALTIGTYDGANIEIRECVGEENFFLFGHNVTQLKELRAAGYQPRDYYASVQELRAAIDTISSGAFSPMEPRLFEPLLHSLFHRDEYFVFADFADYVRTQDSVSEAYSDREKWTSMSILNSARSGHFSSDRSIADYCRDIWKTKRCFVEIKDYRQADAGLRTTGK
jgi:starch phosphorylase